MFEYLAGENTKKRLVSSTEIIKRFKISYQTLNYYTNLGLLRSSIKKGNKRYYDELEVKNNLEKIQKFKNEGYPLRLIRKLLRS